MTAFDFAGADGTRLVAYDFGGSGPPVLLAHATGFHARAYSPLAHRLIERAHVYGVDLRAHGSSASPPPDRLTWDHFATDLLAACDSLGLEDVVGFGHSMGGAALLLAATYRPGTFALVSCYEPIVLDAEGRASGGSEQLAAGARKRRRRFASLEEASERFGSRPPLDALDPDSLWAYVEHGLVATPDGDFALRCDPEDEARTFEAAPACDVYERLADVTCPVHIAFGEHTPAMTRHAAKITATGVPKATLERFGALGHFGPLEDPQAVAEAVIRATE